MSFPSRRESSDRSAPNAGPESRTGAPASRPPAPAQDFAPSANGAYRQAGGPPAEPAGAGRTTGRGLDTWLLLGSGLVGVALIVTPLVLLGLGVVGQDATTGTGRAGGGAPTERPNSHIGPARPIPATGTVGWTGVITGPGSTMPKCVDVDTNSDRDGNAIQLWDCNGVTGQRWTFRGDHTVRAFGKCMTVSKPTSDGTRLVELWECDRSPGQKWVARSDGSLYNLHFRRCLADPHAKTDDGTRLEIRPCNGRVTQRWKLV